MKTQTIDLVSMWQDAMSRPMHSPACSCAVPSAIRLDPHHLELDIMDYVEDKHELRLYAGWVSVRQARAASRTKSFATWFESLAPRQILPELLWIKVLEDVALVLDSMTVHAANRLMPASSLEKGWLSSKA